MVGLHNAFCCFYSFSIHRDSSLLLPGVTGLSANVAKASAQPNDRIRTARKAKGPGVKPTPSKVDGKNTEARALSDASCYVQLV